MPIKKGDRARLKQAQRHLYKAYREITEWEGPWPPELREAEGLMFSAGVRLDALRAGVKLEERNG